MVATNENTVVFELNELRCAAGTDVGMRREENQDSFGVIRHANFHGYFIADGMGGVHGGATASRLAVATIEEVLPPRSQDLSIPLLREVVQKINISIYEAGAKDPSFAGMGTTLVGIVFTPVACFGVNVGDSRLYRVRGDSIVQLSDDHTLVRELVRSGAIKPEDAESHPVSHMLTRSLGPLERVEPDCFALGGLVRPGDVVVLCSDGLYNFVADAEILGVVRQNTIDDANQVLINMANQRGGADNITVLVVSVGQASGAGGRGAEFRKARGDNRASGYSDAELPFRPEGELGELSEKPSAQQPAPTETSGNSGAKAPTVEEPKKRRAGSTNASVSPAKNTLITRSLPVPLLVVAALVFGLVAGDGARKVGRSMVDWLSSGGQIPQTVQVNEPADGAAHNPLDRITSDLRIDRSGGQGEVNLPEIARQVRGSAADQAAKLRRDRMIRERLVRARDFLSSSIKKLESQVGLFASSVAPPREVVASANKEADDVQATIDQVELQIDAASRKLSQWYGRQKRLEEQDPLKLAAEVGASSEIVQGKKSEFELATYEFIKKRDELELYPGDDKLAEQLTRLKERRGRLLRELQDSVRATVDEVLLSTNESLEDLKFQRDTANLQLQALKDDLEIAKLLSDPDMSKRDALKLKVIARLQARQSALAVVKGALGSDDTARIRQALLVVEGLSGQEDG